MSPIELPLHPEPQETLSASEPDDGRVYGLRELIERDALLRLCDSFSTLCGSEIAICDAAGGRIDKHGREYATSCASCDIGERFAAPVIWKDRTLGHVLILDDQPSKVARELAGLVADVLATLCRQAAGIRKRVSELTAVYDLSGLFAGSKDLRSILNIAAKRVCDVMNAKAAGVRVLDEATGELVILGSYNLSPQYLRKGRILLNQNGIDSAAIAGEVVYIRDARIDPRVRFRAEAKREGLVSGLCCPMTYRGSTVGVLRVYTGAIRVFSSFDIELMRAIASQAAGAIVHSRLFDESVAVAKHEHQLKQAGEIQRRMIPHTSPRHANINFGQVYQPSLDVGGDFYDFLNLPNGNLGLAVADVVGKGLPGALMMSSVRSALRAHAHNIFDINEIVTQVNLHMHRDTRVSEFATLFYGVFSPDGTRFTCCNAGHNPPLLLRGQTFIPLDVGGGVIGVFPDAIYEKQVVEIRSGDLLVFYTDGVTEALDYDDNLYGLDRFKQSILRHRDATAPTMANQLLWDVRRFAGLTRQADDITIVVAKVDGANK